MDYEMVIFYAIVACGIIVIFDKCLSITKRNRSEKKNFIVDNAASFLPILLVVFSLRSFAYEGYRIPSGSLKPTLKVGDLILVNKFEYGIRLPVIHKKIVQINNPKRGDIVVFHSPSDKTPPIMIKRVIGVPGDHIQYIDKVLYVNDKKAPQHVVGYDTDSDDGVNYWPVEERSENFLGVQHNIYHIPGTRSEDFDITVPKGKYFMMGDNRDDSGDSRYWGFLPDENIIGKATHVILSYDKLSHPLRLERTGKRII